MFWGVFRVFFDFQRDFQGRNIFRQAKKLVQAYSSAERKMMRRAETISIAEVFRPPLLPPSLARPKFLPNEPPFFLGLAEVSASLRIYQVSLAALKFSAQTAYRTHNEREFGKTNRKRSGGAKWISLKSSERHYYR